MKEKMKSVSSSDVVDVDLSAVARLRGLYDQEIARETIDQELYDFGFQDGSHWVSRIASLDELNRLEQRIESDTWRIPERRNLGLEETIVATLLGLEGFESEESDLIEHFWTPFQREYSIVRSYDYLHGFVIGACKVWRAIQKHPAWTGGESK